eukprot:TRINITY_DN24386_c0_g1_i1.p1 TRINITY_DN24386_c0_g1~~TRINITY_DN24386_c0_g1_i1.p1  ORF type:complete len:222 (+),score=18.05 TRINITY_DN24386_c0_g1_i1:786-1451(+)
MFSMLSLPLLFVPGIGLPADAVIASTLSEEMGQRVAKWLSEAGNVQALVNFAVDRLHANINNALSYAQDQAQAAMAIGDLLIGSFNTYTKPIKDNLAQLTNQEIMFFNWKFDNSESANSHCDNKSIATLVDDGYDTLLQMQKNIGYHVGGVMRHKWVEYLGIYPCIIFNATLCYCTMIGSDGPVDCAEGGTMKKVSTTYQRMVVNHTNRAIGSFYYRHVEI